MELTASVNVNCANGVISICDTTSYSPFDSVSRNLIVYDCDGKLRSDGAVADQWCVSFSGLFAVGDTVQITFINGQVFQYTVELEDIIQPSARISVDTAKLITYELIAKKLAAVIQSQTQSCGNDFIITVGSCTGDCILSIKSKLPGVPLGLSVQLFLVPPDMTDLCQNAPDLQLVADGDGGFYQVIAGIVYVYNGIYYLATATSVVYLITAFPPNTIPELTVTTCPVEIPVVRPDPPIATATQTQAYIPNMGQSECLELQIMEDNIYIGRFDNRIYHPKLYKQTLTITGGTVSTFPPNQILINPPSPALPGIPLSSVYAYSENTVYGTAEQLATQFNNMVRLGGINPGYAWATWDMNVLSIYILAQSFVIGQMNFSKLDIGNAVSVMSIATEIAEWDELVEGKISFNILCGLDLAIRKAFMAACGNCSDVNFMEGMKLQSRKETIKAYLCEGNINAACDLVMETKTLKSYKNGCGC